MTLKLYYTLASPAARASLLAIKFLKIPHELFDVNILQGDQFKTDFKKINPQHTVPTLQDGEHTLWESHAINAYIVSKYAINDDLYPKDPLKRAKIDQRLHFDSGILFPCIRNVTKDVKLRNRKNITPEVPPIFHEGYHFVEKFLQENKYAAGNNITIADFSFVTSLSTMNKLVPIHDQKYPTILKYLSLCQSSISYCKEIETEGLKIYDKALRDMGFEFP